MALNNTYNTIDQGSVYGSVCPECPTSCVSATSDPIRATLVAAGVSSTDLQNYDSCAVGSYINLSHSGSVALVQAIRTAALANVSGAYRIGNLDAAFDTTPTGATSAQLTASSSTTPAQDKLVAGTVPFIVFLTTGTNNTDINAYKLKKGTTAYSTSILGTVTYSNDVHPALVTDNSTYRPYSILVFKMPYNVDTVDRNTAMLCQGTIGYNSVVASAIGAGASATTLTTNNIYNRQWQGLCADPSKWAPTFCSLTSTKVGNASNALDGGTMTVTFNVDGLGSHSGVLSGVTPTVTATGATVSNYSTISYNAGTGKYTFTATVTLVDDPTLVVPNTKQLIYNVTINGSTTTAIGTVLTDAITAILTNSDLTAYNNASAGQIVEISATGYSDLATKISGAGKYGANDATMALCVSSWGIANIACVGGGTQGTATSTFIPANYYPFAFSLMMNNNAAGAGGANPAAAGTVQFGIYGASGGPTASWTPQILLGTNSTPFNASGATGQRRYFIFKGANVQTSQQSAIYIGNGGVSGNFLGGYSLGASVNFSRRTSTTPYDPLTTASNYSWMLGIQCLATPNKQW